MCLFTHKTTFLGYIITGVSIKADESKIDAIQSWPIPNSNNDVRAFHGLASFYRRFIQTIMSPTTKVIKDTSFIWIPKAQSSFDEIKKILTQALHY